MSTASFYDTNAFIVIYLVYNQPMGIRIFIVYNDD